ncbi:LLM class F420-dependent oxidoreductase [Sphaerisporangium sp. NPDC051011]|uniref:LLM class F420-dependent oxidoreductase n=1 Tax=Sphaerisporangium sp. NPDC051011 TaxID=3155792 RepID=UPI003400B60C
MKLGLGLGYWGARQPQGQRELVAEAERLGFDSVWTGEAWGSDALTPLAWLGSGTSTVRLGTAIAQMSARTPTATAMAAMTMDHLTGGRFVLGIGASGPQVVEGWYGAPFPRPLERTREYVSILRQTMRREVVSFDGRHYQLPYQGGAGLGKALKSTLHPVRPEIPILLAAEGPKNVALAGEIADGWLPLFYSPYADDAYRDSLAQGFRARTDPSSARDFEVVCPVSVAIDSDIEAAADRLRPRLALYIGGMGAKGANFHAAVFERMGYEAECAHIQQLYLSGHKDEATAAVPLELVEKVALVGPKEKVADDLQAWSASLVTTMLISGDLRAMRTLAELLL